MVVASKALGMSGGTNQGGGGGMVGTMVLVVVVLVDWFPFNFLRRLLITIIANTIVREYSKLSKVDIVRVILFVPGEKFMVSLQMVLK